MKEKGDIIFYESGSGNTRIEVNEGELAKEATVKESLTVREEGNRKVGRKIEYYSLDVIISVGYRVKSKHGTQFRIWANKTLKDYLTNGYAIDQKRFKEQSRQLEELKQTVKLLGNVIESKVLNTDEATGLLRVESTIKVVVNLINLKN